MFKFENEIENIIKNAGIVGCSVALTDRNSIVFARGYGSLSLDDPDRAADEYSLYRIASITKVVTGVLTMRLVEDGLLSLDAPVCSYLPWLTLKDMDACRRITLRQLLSHTAGLPAEYTPIGPKDERLLADSLKKGLPELELVSQPGEGKYLYSNWGIRIASAAIEAVTGRLYSELAREYVLLPLGMSYSTYDLNVAATYPLSLPHPIGEDGKPFTDHYIKENACRLAVGGLYSNAYDLCKLARMLMRGGVADDGTRVISEASVSEMRRRHAELKSGDGYGLVMQLHNITPERETFGHYGNADPYTSAMYVDPVSGYAAVVLINSKCDGQRRDICDAMLRAMM